MGDPLSDVGKTLVGGSNRDTSQSTQVIDPALLSPENVRQVISWLMNLTGQNGDNFGTVQTGIQNTPFFQNYQAALNNPYIPTSPEHQLLNNIMDQTSAQFASRGLGASPIAASNVAASIAPTLIQLRQQYIGNLANAIGQSLQGQQLGLTERGQNIGAYSERVNALLNLLQFGRRQSLGAQSRVTGSTAGFLNSPFVTSLLGTAGRSGPSSTTNPSTGSGA